MKKGAATEAAVLCALAQRGFAVAIPFGDGRPYDLLIEPREGVFLRVQCKTGRVVKGALEFNARSTDHGDGRRSYIGLADLFGVCMVGSTEVYLVPVAKVCGVTGRLRFDRPRNNQRRRVKYAADYAIASWTTDELAALGDEELMQRTPGASAPRSVPA